MRKKLHRLYLIGIAVFLAVESAVIPLAGALPLALPGPSASVTMDCNPSCQFTPANLTILPGTQVVWTNPGIAPHTSTSTGLWDSGTKLSGESFSRTFDAPGTFAYYCAFHQLIGMTGTIIVVPTTDRVFLPFLGRESSGF